MFGRTRFFETFPNFQNLALKMKVLLLWTSRAQISGTFGFQVGFDFGLGHFWTNLHLVHFWEQPNFWLSKISVHCTFVLSKIAT